jgi:hypothetical protein
MRSWQTWLALVIVPSMLGCGGSEVNDAGFDAPVADTPPRIDAGPPDSGAHCDIDAGSVIDITACNGHLELCDRRYDEVAYLTTHNAMSSAEDGWRLPNQQYRLWRQLEDGVRGFMLDVHPAADGTPLLCHGFCNLGSRPLVDGLTDLRLFLECHPTEVLTIIFESNVPETAIANAFEASGLLRLVHPQAASAPWPTLRELIEADERMIVFTADGDASLDWHLYSYDYAWENPYAAETPAELSCAEDRGQRSAPLWIFNHFLTAPFASPELSEMINHDPFFTERITACRADAGDDLPNFVTVDFYDIGDVVSIVESLNGF